MQILFTTAFVAHCIATQIVHNIGHGFEGLSAKEKGSCRVVTFVKRGPLVEVRFYTYFTPFSHPEEGHGGLNR